jgi:hypothetical protein
MVWNHLWTVAILLTPLPFHYPLPLSLYYLCCVSYIHKFHMQNKETSWFIYAYIFLTIVKGQVVTYILISCWGSSYDVTCIKERVVWDYYYIEIVKCYLCLALNHQSGDLIGTMFETWKLWGACDVCECQRRINAFIVQTIGHYFRACSYSLCQVQRLNSENGDLST